MQDKNIRSDNFLSRLTDEMTRQGLNQTSLAKSVGVSQSRVSDWLSGKAMPQKRTATALAHALGVEIKWLLYGGKFVRHLQDIGMVTEALASPKGEEKLMTGLRQRADELESWKSRALAAEKQLMDIQSVLDRASSKK